MRPVIFVLVTMVATHSFAAKADAFFAVTPSGQTEMLFDQDVTATSDAIASKCIDVGWVVISTTSTLVLCEAPMNAGQQMLGQLLLGNQYSTPPKRFFRYNITSVQGASRVQASGWMETQMAFGQMQRQDFSGPEFHNSQIGFLMATGGRLPPGTTFPNHAVIGVQLDERSYSKSGVTVSQVDPGSAADAAGILVQDTISRVAGERIKSQNDLLDAAERAAKNPTYEVEIVRAGNKQKLTLHRRFRPQIVAPELAKDRASYKDIAEGQENASKPNSSIADELAKFAELRDKGIITEEEFQQQKRLLLQID